MFCAYAKRTYLYRRIFAYLAIHDIVCVACDCAVFSMFSSSCAYALLVYEVIRVERHVDVLTELSSR